MLTLYKSNFLLSEMVLSNGHERLNKILYSNVYNYK